jgi:hypothetical protein
VARIKFNVRENPQLSLLDHKEHHRIRETEAYKAARSLGLEDVVAIYFIETKGEIYVAEVAAYVEAKKPKNPGGYLAHALKSGYGVKSPEERQAAKEAKDRTRILQAKQHSQKDAERAQAMLEKRFRDHQKSRVFEIMSQLTASEIDYVREIMSFDIGIPILADRWNGIDRDIARISELPKQMQRDMNKRLYDAVLGRWGNAEDIEFEKYFKSLF